MQFKDWDGVGRSARPDLRATLAGQPAEATYDLKNALDVFAPPSDQIKLQAIADLARNVKVDPAAVTTRILNACSDGSSAVRAAAREALLKIATAVPPSELLAKAAQVLGGNERGAEEQQAGLKILAGLCVLCPADAFAFFLGKDETALAPLIGAWVAAEKAAVLAEKAK